MVTSITVVPNPSSPGSVAMWEQVQEWFPVFSSYGGSGPGSLGTEEEDCAVGSPILTGMSSQTLHAWNPLLSMTWTWFGVIQLRSAYKCKGTGTPTLVPSLQDPQFARSQTILVDPQMILGSEG